VVSRSRPTPHSGPAMRSSVAARRRGEWCYNGGSHGGFRMLTGSANPGKPMSWVWERLADQWPEVVSLGIEAVAAQPLRGGSFTTSRSAQPNHGSSGQRLVAASSALPSARRFDARCPSSRRPCWSFSSLPRSALSDEGDFGNAPPVEAEGS